MQKPKKTVEGKMSWIEKAAKTQRLLRIQKKDRIQNHLQKEKRKRVDLIQEDSEGAQTADALTNDGRKTDEVVILVETEEIPVIAPEAIEDETIASEKKAGVTGAGDAIEDRTVEGIRDQLENPKTGRKEERSPC